MKTLGKFARTAVTAIACAGVMGWAHGAALSLSFGDAVGDQQGGADVTGMSLVFDNVTGDYTIRLTASAANPFTGSFRVTINLFNPDTGTTAQNPSLFGDHFNDFDLGLGTTEMVVLTGTNVRLRSWDEGDRVAISTGGGLGNPDDATGFASGVSSIGGPYAADVIGSTANSMFTPSPVALITAVTPEGVVPEPGSAALVGLALVALAGFERRKRSTKA